MHQNKWQGQKLVLPFIFDFWDALGEKFGKYIESLTVY